MKELIVIVLSGAALALAGCKPGGGSTDQYNTTTGATSSTNYDWNSATNNYQGGAISPGDTNSGVLFGPNHFRGLDDTNRYQGGAISPGNTNSGALFGTNYYRGSDTNWYNRY